MSVNIRASRTLIAVALMGLLSSCAQSMDENYFKDHGGHGGSEPGATGTQQDPFCAPCNSSSTCGGGGNLCLRNRVTGEKFCSRTCDVDSDCPTSFKCMTVQGTKKQCVSPSGSCSALSTQDETPAATPPDEPQDPGDEGTDTTDTGAARGACNGACIAGRYDSCTCGTADACGWQNDGRCDKRCAETFGSAHFDDAHDCNTTSDGGTSQDNNGGDSDNEDEPDEPEPEAPAPRTYAITAVADNLDPQDMDVAASGYKSAGYTEKGRVRNVTTSQLRSFVTNPELTVLYHTGHGNEGLVKTSDGTLTLGNTRIAAKNVVWATCLTLVPSWASVMGPTSETVMGYTKESLDGIDNDVAKSYTAKIKEGKAHALAWYMANAGVGSLKDRWATYTRVDGTVREFSARKGNAPVAYLDTKWVELGQRSGLRISATLLDDANTHESSFKRASVGGLARPVDQVESSNFGLLTPTKMTREQAIAASDAWLVSHGGRPRDAVLDEAVAIQSRRSSSATPETVGYMVRYIRQYNGIPVRSNLTEPHIATLVTSTRVMAASRFWPAVSARAVTKVEPVLMGIGQAARASADKISSLLKGSKMDLVKAVPVYGTRKVGDDPGELEPAFELQSTDGTSIVVSALTGEVL